MIISLQGELKELKASIEKHKPQTDSFSYEEVVQEVFDRNQRKRNLVIFGVQEDQPLRTARERHTFDSNKVKRILEVLSYEGESNSIKPIRLGKFDATKRYSRPLKIKLDDKSTVHRLIKKAGCKCKLDNINYHIYVLYIPPQVTQSELEAFLDNFEQLLVNEENVIVLGDFNIPNYVNNNNNDPKTYTFNNFLDFVGVQQQNSVLNSFNRLLDLALSNQLVDVTRGDIPMINEDEYHPALKARIFVKKDKANSVITTDNLIYTYNFRKADFVQLYNPLLNSDWTFLDIAMDVDTMVEAFYNRGGVPIIVVVIIIFIFFIIVYSGIVSQFSVIRKIIEVILVTTNIISVILI
nr:unnamed protein product [Callosobruchus analis]